MIVEDAISCIDAVAQKRNVCITVADPAQADCPLVYVNRAFESTTGYRATSVIGRNCRFLQTKQTERATVKELSKAIADSESSTSCLLNARSNGEQFHNFLVLNPLQIGDGKILIVGCQYDLSRRAALLQLPKHLNGIQSFAKTLSTRHNQSLTMATEALMMRTNAIVMLVKDYLMRMEWDNFRAG